MTSGQRMISRISSHVLDTTSGRPAAGIPVALHLISQDGPDRLVGGGVTDGDGRIQALTDRELEPGTYRFVFDTADYFVGVHRTVFYPRITIEAYLDGSRGHYHIPVLASLYSYSTYLGS